MSIVTCYARLTQPQLEQVCASPTPTRALFKSPPDGCEAIDLDRAADVIAWLLSPSKRAEQQAQANMMAEMEGDPIPFPDPPAPAPLDILLIAIEGRLIGVDGRSHRREPRIDAGYGAARVFEPTDVEQYSQALAVVDEAALRASLDFALMDKLYLPVESWQAEGESTFVEYILPAFRRLQAFYANAAVSQQCVLVWHS